MRLLATLAVLLAFAGCEQMGPPGPRGPSDPGYAAPELLHTDALRYDVGSQVSVRLTNRTGRTVTYNLCRSQLERQNSEGDWRQMQPTLAEACTAELRALRPGQTATYAFKTDPRARAGPYRIRNDLDDPQGRVRIEAFSNTFTLVREGSD